MDYYLVLPTDHMVHNLEVNTVVIKYQMTSQYHAYRYFGYISNLDKYDTQTLYADSVRPINKNQVRKLCYILGVDFLTLNEKYKGNLTSENI